MQISQVWTFSAMVFKDGPALLLVAAACAGLSNGYPGSLSRHLNYTAAGSTKSHFSDVGGDRRASYQGKVATVNAQIDFSTFDENNFLISSKEFNLKWNYG